MKQILLCKIVDFSEVNRKAWKKSAEEEKKGDTSYERVLREIEGSEPKKELEEIPTVPIENLPTFDCLLNLDNFHSISQLEKSPGFCQIDFSDESINYIKLDWDRAKEIFAQIGTIYE